MSKLPGKPPARSFESIAEAVCDRLAKNERVRRTLPGEGRLRFDRQLPFLCVYRAPAREDQGTRDLVTSEAAYLFASGEKPYRAGVNLLCGRISAAMREHFGTFLLIEVWSQPERDDTVPLLAPSFEIVTAEPNSLPAVLEAFTAALAEISIGGHAAQVTTREDARVSPPGLPPLRLADGNSLPAGCVTLGLAVRPIYQDARTGGLFPMVLQSLRSQLAWALRKAVSRFSGGGSAADSPHYHTFGPSTLVKVARLVDQQLCEVSDSFDYLLQVTPTNAEQAWIEFQASDYRTEPLLQYRPLRYHPSLLKRRLFDIEIDRIEDPTLAHLLWEKQDELDRQLTALRQLGTPEFLYCSLQHHGAAEQDLVELAEQILARFPEPSAGAATLRTVELGEIVQRAREEIDFYHQQKSEFHATVEICDTIASGIMVSQGRLLISDSLRLSEDRVEPLLHHEIGTHLLTYFNGRCQPFRQLYAGLAGYEELQEGLAVMAEYLTGGLTPSRLRTLAGRVIAVRSMTDSAGFRETFDRLHQGYGFTARQSFVSTLRVYRGGGLTKDVIYLRGLRNLLAYLSGGHAIEPLYVGKIGLQHVPYVQEMRRRGIINAPGVLPRFWSDPGLRARLERCRGRSIVELLET